MGTIEAKQPTKEESTMDYDLVYVVSIMVDGQWVEKHTVDTAEQAQGLYKEYRNQGYSVRYEQVKKYI